MARIAGIDLPRDKRIEIALTYIFGIGRKTATRICSETGVNPDTRVRDLTEDDTAKIREYIDHNCRVEGDLRRDVAFDIKRLIEIGCYRGIRHRKGLPVRGQRSKTNARTRKGPRRTMANKKNNREGYKTCQERKQRQRLLPAGAVSVKILTADPLISSQLSIIQSLLSPTCRGMRFPGRVRASLDSGVPENPLLLPPKLLPNQPQKPLWSTA